MMASLFYTIKPSNALGTLNIHPSVVAGMKHLNKVCQIEKIFRVQNILRRKFWQLLDPFARPLKILLAICFLYNFSLFEQEVGNLQFALYEYF